MLKQQCPRCELVQEICYKRCKRCSYDGFMSWLHLPRPWRVTKDDVPYQRQGFLIK